MLNDDAEPTLAAIRLIYGPDVLDTDRRVDDAIDALRIVKEGLTGPEKRYVKRQGWTEKQYTQDARKKVTDILGIRIPSIDQAESGLRAALRADDMSEGGD